MMNHRGGGVDSRECDVSIISRWLRRRPRGGDRSSDDGRRFPSRCRIGFAISAHLAGGADDARRGPRVLATGAAGGGMPHEMPCDGGIGAGRADGCQRQRRSQSAAPSPPRCDACRYRWRILLCVACVEVSAVAADARCRPISSLFFAVTRQAFLLFSGHDGLASLERVVFSVLRQNRSLSDLFGLL